MRLPQQQSQEPKFNLLKFKKVFFLWKQSLSFSHLFCSCEEKNEAFAKFLPQCQEKRAESQNENLRVSNVKRGKKSREILARKSQRCSLNLEALARFFYNSNTLTSLPLDGIARNYFSSRWIHKENKIPRVWIHFIPTFLYLRRRKTFGHSWN